MVAAAAAAVSAPRRKSGKFPLEDEGERIPRVTLELSIWKKEREGTPRIAGSLKGGLFVFNIRICPKKVRKIRCFYPADFDKRFRDGVPKDFRIRSHSSSCN